MSHFTPLDPELAADPIRPLSVSDQIRPQVIRSELPMVAVRSRCNEYSVTDMNSFTEPLRIDRTFPPSVTISTCPLEYVSLSAPIDEVNRDIWG